MMGYQPQPIRGRGESKKMALREVSTRPQDSCEVKLHGKRVCSFCGSEPNALYGKFFTAMEANLSVHQYCMFFASGLAQNGDDNDGFDGFLLHDILKEVIRGKRLKCSFCRKFGATVGCSVQHCKTKYHYPCGQGNGTLEQYFGTFDAYCSKHKPVQMLPMLNLIESVCAICLEALIEDNEVTSFLKMPCCNESYMHKDCLQKHALSSGYFCKCPTCKNGDQFQKELKIHGVYIPERDALWEDGNAFAELLEVYSRCDCKYCYCPGGRDFIGKFGYWKLHRCEVCGHSASHRKCAEFEGKFADLFQCDNCIYIESMKKFKDRIEKETTSCAVSLTDVKETKLFNNILKPSKNVRSFGKTTINSVVASFVEEQAGNSICKSSIETTNQQTNNATSSFNKKTDVVENAKKRLRPANNSKLSKLRTTYMHSTSSSSQTCVVDVHLQSALYIFLETALRNSIH